MSEPHRILIGRVVFGPDGALKQFHQPPDKTMPTDNPLTWTSTPPSVPGWYWFKPRNTNFGKRVVQVTRQSLDGNFGYASGDWSGPLPEPKEA